MHGQGQPVDAGEDPASGLVEQLVTLRHKQLPELAEVPKEVSGLVRRRGGHRPD